MALYFDHLVVNVDNLEEACQKYRDAGFTVTPGGNHGGGLSKNALVFFQDDSFIELFALTGSWKVALLKLVKGMKFLKRYQYSKKWGLVYRFYSRSLELKPGISDICFISDNYENDHQRIDGAGIFITRTLTGRRKKPDGSQVKWQMASPFINELPFFRSAYAPPRELSEADVKHSNGVKGINKITIVALDYKDMVSKYETFLGQAPISGDKNGTVSTFKLKNTIIEVIKSSNHKDLQEQFRGHGMGMYGVSFEVDQYVEEPLKEKLVNGLVVHQ